MKKCSSEKLSIIRLFVLLFHTSFSAKESSCLQKKMTSSKSPLSSLVLLCQKTLARSLSDVSSLRVLAVPRYQHLLSGILRHLFQDLVTNHQQKGIVYDKICSLLQVDKLIRCVIV